MTIIYLVRHAKYLSPHNIIPSRMPNVHLSADGKNQASKLGDYFMDKDISAIYSSPMTRTQETAEIIAQSIGKQIIFDDRLLEVLTPFQGLSEEENSKMQESTSLYYHPYHLKYGGETIESMIKRLKSMFLDIKDQHNNKNILFVSHGDPIMVLYGLIKNITIVPNKNLETLFGYYIPKAGIIKAIFDDEKLPQTEKFFDYA
jgi:broad specificity phosphatase PhoE